MSPETELKSKIEAVAAKLSELRWKSLENYWVIGRQLTELRDSLQGKSPAEGFVEYLREISRPGLSVTVMYRCMAIFKRIPEASLFEQWLECHIGVNALATLCEAKQYETVDIAFEFAADGKVIGTAEARMLAKLAKQHEGRRFPWSEVEALMDARNVGTLLREIQANEDLGQWDGCEEEGTAERLKPLDGVAIQQSIDKMEIGEMDEDDERAVAENDCYEGQKERAAAEATKGEYVERNTEEADTSETEKQEVADEEDDEADEEFVEQMTGSEVSSETAALRQLEQAIAQACARLDEKEAISLRKRLVESVVQDLPVKHARKLMMRKGIKKHIPEQRFVPPSFEAVEHYVKENDLGIESRDFFDYYDGQGWRTAKGVQISNWKAKAREWSKRDAADKAEKEKQEAPQRPKTYGTPMPPEAQEIARKAREQKKTRIEAAKKKAEEEERKRLSDPEKNPF